ncbi:plasmid mobilization protein [Pseudomonas sp. P129]|uniref:plasmid mobilization protein n=1 Tax=Pseudomonas sp. P129 TaxID=2823887 RepID=UPI001CE373CC|nr:CopG family transcriptional regulator [Pseudomonas sp. P129]MCA5967361.1 CopG family transcriptional regulator [Pseudomonas sp. P129]
MTSGTKQKTTARRRGKPIEVWVTDEEKAMISERANEAGMSRSGYLRALGLNSPIRSVVDLTAVADLAKVNGDLGRVAGLLKLWLAEKNGQGASSVEVERMMVEFRELQAGIREKMSAVVFTRKREG